MGSWHIGQQRAALLRRDRQRLDVAGLHLAQRSEHGIAFIVDLTRQHGIQHRGRAGKRNHRRLDADRRVEKQTTDIGYRAEPGMPDIELVRVGFRVSNKFLKVIGGKILADDQQFRIFGRQSNRLEVLLRIVAEIRIERRRQRIGAKVTGQDRVSVGRRAGGAERSGGATGTHDILHHEFLAEMAAEDVSDDSAGDIGRAAGGKRNDNRDRPGGIILSPRVTCSGYCHHSDDRRCQMPCHLFPPEFAFCHFDVTLQASQPAASGGSPRGV